jgi:ABC-type sugar transport system substrate-binding protein
VFHNSKFLNVRRFRWVVLTAIVAVTALALAACGSSSSSGSGSSGSSSTSGSSSSSSSGSSASNSAAVASAKAAVAKLMVRPTSLSVPALPSKPPTGKTIDFIACGVPVCQEYIPLLKAATDAVGWKVKAINSGVTPQSIAAAYDQAVRDKPAGVIGSGGNDPSLFAHQLSELKSENVPVVLQVVPPSTAPGLTAIVYGASYNTAGGQSIADEIIADSGGKDAHVAIFHSPGTPIYANADKAISDAMSSSSCSSCSADTVSFPETDLGSTLPSLVVSYLRSHSNINYLFFDFTSEVDGVPVALQQAGLSSKIKITTLDMSSTERAYMENGQELAAAGNPWPEILWTEANIIYRNTMGLSLTPGENVKLPSMLLMKGNLPASTGSPYFPLVANYQSIFKKAWNVG